MSLHRFVQLYNKRQTQSYPLKRPRLIRNGVFTQCKYKSWSEKQCGFYFKLEEREAAG